MIYSLAFNLEGISNGGHVHERSSELLPLAKSLASTGLDLLDDSEVEWFDLPGAPADAYELLNSNDEDQLWDVIGQISDMMKIRGLGYIDLKEHEGISELLAYHHASEWASPVLQARIAAFGLAYSDLLKTLDDEWGTVI